MCAAHRQLLPSSRCRPAFRAHCLLWPLFSYSWIGEAAAAVSPQVSLLAPHISERAVPEADAREGSGGGRWAKRIRERVRLGGPDLLHDIKSIVDDSCEKRPDHPKCAKPEDEPTTSLHRSSGSTPAAAHLRSTTLAISRGPATSTPRPSQARPEVARLRGPATSSRSDSTPEVARVRPGDPVEPGAPDGAGKPRTSGPQPPDPCSRLRTTTTRSPTPCSESYNAKDDVSEGPPENWQPWDEQEGESFWRADT